MQSETNTMHPDPTSAQMTMDSIKFFCEMIGSIVSLGITLLGVYLRMYVRDALHDHADAIQRLVADNYVRRDVYEADMRGIRAQGAGQS